MGLRKVIDCQFIDFFSGEDRIDNFEAVYMVEMKMKVIVPTGVEKMHSLNQWLVILCLCNH